MLRGIALSIITLLATESALAARAVISFDMFPSEAIFIGQPAPLYWVPEAAGLNGYVAGRVGLSVSEDYYKRASEAKWRFGGRYFIYTTGCGTACQTGVLFDLLTGEPVAQLPTGTTGYEYRPASDLLVVNPVNDQVLAEQWLYWDNRTHYYYWNGNEFAYIGNVPWPKPERGAADTTASPEEQVPDIPLPKRRPTQ